jgi:predicted Zn-dependent protease
MPPPVDRITTLTAMLEKKPHDAFLLYAMALEHRKKNDASHAIEYFDRAIGADPNYCPAWQQKAQVLEAAGDVDGAKEAYRNGIAAAGRVGDGHAQQEMAAALAMME